MTLRDEIREGVHAPDPLDTAPGAPRRRNTMLQPRRRLLPMPRLNPFRGNLSLTIGAVIFGLFLIVALLSLVWTPYNPRAVGLDLPYLSPSWSHLFGTDGLGSDVASRAMAATHLDLYITVVAVLIALVIGSIIGTIAGYYGGWIDATIMRLLEVFQAFPAFLLAMLVVQAAGPGTGNVIVILAVIGIPDYLRLARAGVLARKHLQFVEAAKMAGGRSYRIAFRHLLPNSFGPLLAQTSVNAGWVVLVISSLGFLGIGIPADVPEWGAMIATGRDGIVIGQWWMSFFPGLMVFGLAASLYLIGDGLADVLDARRRS
jgi:peptide/nickel transport system permease protein